jgi:hypothetical protein
MTGFLDYLARESRGRTVILVSERCDSRVTHCNRDRS